MIESLPGKVPNTLETGRPHARVPDCMDRGAAVADDWRDYAQLCHEIPRSVKASGRSMVLRATGSKE